MYTSPSGKIYIGQTINESSRKSQHKKSMKNEKSRTRFVLALRKYGYENFEYTLLIKFKPTAQIEKLKRVLNKLEQRYIKLYNSNNPEVGYNLTTGGDSFLHSEETKEKIRQNALNRPEEWKQKLSTSAKKKFENGIPDYILEGLAKAREIQKINGYHCNRSEEAKRNRSAAQDKFKVKVKQYDLENNFITEFESIEEAARSIEGKVQKTVAKKIGECCNGKRATIYGFIWKRE